MLILICNFLVYFFWFIKVIKKEGISIYSSIILMFVCIAFCSIFIMNNGIYEQDFGIVNQESLSILPYVLCFLCYVILFYPLKKIGILDVEQYDILGNKQVNLIVNVLIIAYLALLLIRLSELHQGLATGLAEVYIMRHSEGITVFEHSLPVNLFLSLMDTIDVIATPCLSFYAIMGEKKRYIGKGKTMLILLLCNLPNIISAVAKGSRGGIFLNMICFLFFIILFYRKMSPTLRSSLFKVIGAVLLFAVMYAWLISVARYEDSETNPIDGILRYFGEPFINLGHLFWDHVKEHPYGTRLFDRILNQFPKDWSRTDIYMYWWNYTGVPTFNFKTMFGDFYIEFGWWQSVVIISLIGFSFTKILSGMKMNFATLPIAYFYFQICVFSFAGFTKHDMGFIYELVAICFFIKTLPLFVKKNY